MYLQFLEIFSKHEHLPKWDYVLHTILYLTFLNLTIYIHDISMSVHLDQLHSDERNTALSGGVSRWKGAPLLLLLSRETGGTHLEEML